MKKDIQLLIATTVDIVQRYEQEEGDGRKLTTMQRFLGDIEFFDEHVVEMICTAISEECLKFLQNKSTDPPDSDPHIEIHPEMFPPSTKGSSNL
jgi:predicted ThiF/HesA family dinucleotide-utilizing enzyme